MDENKDRLLKWLPLCDYRCRAWFVKVLWLFLLLYPFHQYYNFRFQYTQWDLLLFTGVLTLILGLRLVARMPDRFRDAITRLEHRQVLEFGAMSREQLFEEIRNKGDLWARVTGLLVALAIGAAFLYALSINFAWQRSLLGFAEMIAGYVVGNYLGRMASYGQLGWHLKKRGLGIRLDPFHVDGVGGLKPVGDYYFYQAMVVAIPAIFLAVWWFLFPIWPRDYAHWENAYLGLMGLAFALEITAFILPLWSFHEIMVKQKEQWQEVADTLGNEIADLQRQLDSGAPEDAKKIALSRIKEKTERYWAIENMVTWPVDVRTRHQFRFNNILIFIPLMGDIVKRNINWDRIYEILKNLAT